MRLTKIIFAFGLLATVLVLCLKAQPASTPVSANQSAQSSVAPPVANGTTANTESKAEGVPPAPPALFTVLGFPVTNSMVCSWIVAAIILILVRLATWRQMREIPSGLQNVMEALVEGWEGLIGDILEPRVTRWVFPFATTFFIFIVMSNLVDLVPGVGSIGFYHDGKFTPYFRPPTTDANLTVAMAGIFLVMSLFWAVRYNGFWGLIKHIFGVKMDANKWVYPLFFLLFIFIGAMELLSVTFARPVALAMRLYGNIFAGESILDMIYHNNLLVAIVLSSCMYLYETFVCLVQAFVFAMLVVAFTGTLCTHADEEHGH
ncbi:MAG TPA: F0F1 ATP synthase subunit A [Verrucomicrobiae bacterium]|nr:F0F1 ATP synthase subunit A [Verrucomicrobiae bacterium]